MKKCPFCAEEIQDDAIKCKHCGSMLTPPPPPTEKAPANPQTSSTPICQQCGGVMKKSSEGKSGGMGCLLLIIGLLLTPVIIGIFIILYALHVGSKRRGLWVCTKCGYQIERKIKWYELG